MNTTERTLAGIMITESAGVHLSISLRPLQKCTCRPRGYDAVVALRPRYVLCSCLEPMGLSFMGQRDGGMKDGLMDGWMGLG